MTLLTGIPINADMFEDIQFKGVWRDYQQRVLDELQDHLGDMKLHVVAAPGAGKTVLGLEVMRRLAQPAIILSSTLTVRTQWADRLNEMFMRDKGAEIVSFDLREPKSVTSTTYQSLHALWNAKEDNSDNKVSQTDFGKLIEYFLKKEMVTVIVDEAHHLRKEWWRALNEFVDSLPNATLVALTATPPYDVSYAEWLRYDTLCGSIDAEISVPELVRNGNLCPHQDHIYLSLPVESEQELLNKRYQGIAAIVDDLLVDQGFLDSLATHGWVASSDLFEEDILEDPEFLSSMLISLTAGGRSIPAAPMDLLGVNQKQIPAFSLHWLEILLQGILFKYPDHFDDIKDRRKRLEKQCRKAGLIENKRVKLSQNKALFRTMAGSLAKLRSIVEIARAETLNLRDDMRMVILTDYVRAADIPRRAGEAFNPAKLGVIPIFETLRRHGPDKVKLGVLTGSLVIIPDDIGSAVAQALTVFGFKADNVKTSPLTGCPGYSKFMIEGAGNQKKVALITWLFNRGAIHILIGTQSLLGEGWDAPTVNSLILASNVGSYMLSNQMRGRAIRTDPSRPNKVANIWHLGTVELQSESYLPSVVTDFIWERGLISGSDRYQRLGSDIALLSRRFEAFEGIANDNSNLISNGIERLGLVEVDWSVETVSGQNSKTLDIAANRQSISEKWRYSLGDATERTHVHQVAEANYAPRSQSYSQTLQYLSISAVFGGLSSAAGAMRQFQSVKTFATFVMIFGILAFLYSLPKLFKAGRLFFRNGSLEKSLKQVGQTLLDGMHHAGYLSRPIEEYVVEIDESIRGNHIIILHGAARAEEKYFFEALSEILGPIQNPRYLLIRKSWLSSRLRQDYHAVPTILGKNKQNAEYFSQCWTRQIGSVELIFARQREGRKKLLKARSTSLAAGFQRQFDRRSEWR